MRWFQLAQNGRISVFKNRLRETERSYNVVDSSVVNPQARPEKIPDQNGPARPEKFSVQNGPTRPEKISDLNGPAWKSSLLKLKIGGKWLKTQMVKNLHGLQWVTMG